MMRFYCTQNTRQNCMCFATHQMTQKGGFQKRSMWVSRIAQIFRLIEYLTLIFLLRVEKLKFYSFKHLHSVFFSAFAFFFHLDYTMNEKYNRCHCWGWRRWFLFLLPFALCICSAFFPREIDRHVIQNMHFRLVIFSPSDFRPLQHIRQLMYWIVQANSCCANQHILPLATLVFYCPLYTHKNHSEKEKAT